MSGALAHSGAPAAPLRLVTKITDEFGTMSGALAHSEPLQRHGVGTNAGSMALPQVMQRSFIGIVGLFWRTRCPLVMCL